MVSAVFGEPLKVKPAIQNYEWGVKGNKSLVASLGLHSKAIDSIEGGKSYAELWIGTHVNGPSFVNNVPLSQIVTKDLPFLLKILSVEKALSIQAHPDKALAQKLHSLFPTIYKDPNHKPEMAIALTNFEALCGFRPISAIKEFLENIPELASLVDPFEEFDLKLFFKSFISCNTEKAKSAIASYKRRLLKKENLSKLENLWLRLQSQYPDEVGSFCVFIMNYMTLEPGQAIFLAANEPHAYISGDCVECMAPSDNVVRAGLTPKFRDIDTLCEMLSYKTFFKSDLLLQPTKFKNHSVIYNAPVEEFQVVATSLKEEQSESFCFPETCILICTCGNGWLNDLDISFGSIYAIPPGYPFECKTSDTPLTIFIAIQNCEF